MEVQLQTTEAVSRDAEDSQERRRITAEPVYDFSKVDFTNPEVRASLHRAARVLIEIHQRKLAREE